MYSGEVTLCDDVQFGNDSSGDDAGFAVEVETNNSTEIETGADEYLFEVLSPEGIVQLMEDSIREVNTVVEISATTTRILLNHFKWDKEKLIERFYNGDQDQMFHEAHVINPFRKPTVADRPKVRLSRVTSAADTEECEICFTVLPTSMMTGLACGHRFCTQCWGEYLTGKIMEEGIGQSIPCAAEGCDILVDDRTVMRLLIDPKAKLKYQHLITNSFVECNRLLRWCPSPDCNNAIKVQSVEARAVTCKCTHTFCFACGENWHDPVKCHLLRKWIEKCNADSETSSWIAANTKECPECKATIERDGGCNHVVCKNQNCNAEFCWVCLGPWELHGTSWYNCNRYNDAKAKKARAAQDRSRANLQRYVFYYERYMTHMQSLKFERELYTAVKDRVERMQRYVMTWIELHFLKKAVDTLCQCRQTLMYTYVFAYYVRKNNQSVIFEENQKDFENATETLSEYLERYITSESMADIKQKLQDKYRYCYSRRKVLLEHVHEGHENDWWEYTEYI
jgi:ariadne-1